MAIFEFQVSASSFLSGQLSNLQSQQFCLSPVNIDGHQIVIDHIEFGSNSLQRGKLVDKLILFEQPLFGLQSQTITTAQVQVVQPVTVVVADLADVEAHPNGSATLFPLPATVVVNVDYQLRAGPGFFLNIAADHVDVGQPPPLPPGVDAQQVEQQFKTLVQGLLPVSELPFDFVTPLGASDVNNIGLSADSDLTRLVFRVESAANTFSPQVWQSFFDGNVTDHLQGSDWALFIPRNFLELMVSTQISLGVGTGTGKFHLVTGIGSTYSNASGKAHVTTSFGGNVDATICTLWVDVTIDSDITMGAKNSLTIDANVTPKVQTSLCSIALDILNALAADVIGLLDLMDLLFGSLTDVFSHLASLLSSAIHKGAPKPISVQSCTTVTQFHYICTRSLGIPQTSTQGKLSLDSLAALDDGIALLGTLQPAPVTTASVQPAINNFGWVGPAISCGEVSGKEVAQFRANPKLFVSLHADVTLNNGGSAPLYVCGVTVINDPLGVFPQQSVQVQDQQTPIFISIDIRYPGDAYFQNPYACQLLVATSGGTRLVSVPPPPALTQADINAMANALADQIGGCAKLINNWVTLLHAEFVWAVDPPPDAQVDHSWEIAVRGLPEGEQVSLVDTAGQTLVTATAQAGQTVRVSATLSPAVGAVNEVGLLHGARQGSLKAETVAETPAVPIVPPTGQAAGMAVIQRLMIHTSTILLRQAAKQLGAVYIEGVPCALIAVEDGALAYTLSTPSLPRLAYTWKVPGLRGVLSSQSGLVGFGDDGFALLKPGAVLPLIPTLRQIDPVRDAAGGQLAIYALDQVGLHSYTLRLQRVNSIAIKAATRIAQLGNSLFVAEATGLRAFDISNPLNPVSISAYPLPRITDLAVATDGEGRKVLAVPVDGPAQLIDFTNAANPRAVATYSQPAWFPGTARLPGLLLRLSDDGRSVRVSAFGRSKKL